MLHTVVSEPLHRALPDGHHGAVDLETAADDLYAVNPTGFVPRRDALVAQARADGDTTLAKQIGKLRKPTVSAWLGNLLARGQRAELEQLVQLGALLREAQQTLHGPQLRELGNQRGQLVTALAGLARRAAADQGVRISEAAVREVESTLTAALSDPEAAAQLFAGRLETALAVTGGGFDLGSARPGLHSVRPPDAEADPEQQARQARADALDAAERRLAKLRLSAANAEQRRVSAEDDAATAEEDLAHARAEVQGLEARLESARQAAEAAAVDLSTAEAGVVDAEQELERLRDGALDG